VSFEGGRLGQGGAICPADQSQEHNKLSLSQFYTVVFQHNRPIAAIHLSPEDR
jgi:hypothetical protein